MHAVTKDSPAHAIDDDDLATKPTQHPTDTLEITTRDTR